MNLLLDTNVLIDYLGRKPPFYDSAKKIIASGYFGDAKLWTPVQSLKDAFYVLEKYAGSLRVQNAIIHACEVITPVGLAGGEALRAARLQWEDYEDCLIAIAAEKVKADYLITRDKKDFERSLVPVMTPDEWLFLMEKEYLLSYELLDNF